MPKEEKVPETPRRKPDPEVPGSPGLGASGGGGDAVLSGGRDESGASRGNGDSASLLRPSHTPAPGAGSTPLRQLVAFYYDLVCAMGEFHRLYGLTGAGPAVPAETPDLLLKRLEDPATAAAAHAQLAVGIRELKLHHAALLEAYHQAAHDGACELLDTIDPERLRREFEGEKVRVGPIRISCRWKPLLMQAIWEEQLARFRRYRAMEATDFERFFREGFRKGYRRFLDPERPAEPPPERPPERDRS